MRTTQNDPTMHASFTMPSNISTHRFYTGTISLRALVAYTFLESTNQRSYFDKTVNNHD